MNYNGTQSCFLPACPLHPLCATSIVYVLFVPGSLMVIDAKNMEHWTLVVLVYTTESLFHICKHYHFTHTNIVKNKRVFRTTYVVQFLSMATE